MLDAVFMSTAAGMAATIATWLLVAALLVGIGALAFPRSMGRGNSPADGSDASLQLLLLLWTGWAILIALLQVWHLAAPVDDRAAVAFAVLGIVGLAVRACELRAVCAALRGAPKHTISSLLLFTALVLLIANVAMGRISNYDTGLYHLQDVAWNSDYAIVPGLANLHGRLGFNNSSLLFNAILDFGPWTGRGHHLGGALLLLSVTLACAGPAWELIARPALVFAPDAAARSRLARAMLFAPTLLTGYRNISSPSPDLPATLLGIVIAMLLVDRLLRAREGDLRRSLLVPISLLAAVGVTVKLSLLPFGVAAVLVVWFGDHQRYLRGAKGNCLAAVAIGLVVLGTWAVRGVVLSGYPAFPAAVFGVDVDWRVPEKHAREEARLIVAWARTRSIESSDGPAWILPWAEEQSRDLLKVTLPLAIAVGMASIAVLRGRGAGSIEDDRQSRAFLLLAAPPAGHVLFLIVTAPDLSRFGGASLWLFAVLATLYWIEVEGRGGGRRIATGIVWMSTAILAAVAIAKLANHVVGPGGMRPIPVAEIKEVRTDSGLRVFVPLRNDQAWAAPLPSSPYAHPSLRLRDEGNMAAGFAIGVESKK